MGQRVKFYVDEHVAKAIVMGLRLRGVGVQTVAEAGLLRATDESHLKRALSEGRVLFTQDADYLRLHAAGVKHAGLVYAHQGTSIGDIVHGLMLIHQVLEAEDLLRHVEYL